MSSENDYASLEVQKVVLHPVVAGEFAADEAVDKAYVDAKLTALINGAPELLNTLSELSAALGADANFSTTIMTAIGAESTARNNADVAIQGQITALSTSSSAAVAAESAARSAADVLLTTNLNAEITLRNSQKTALDTSIADEVAARVAAVNAVNSAVSSEASFARSAEGALSDRINSEAQSRYDEDVLLGNAVGRLQSDKFDKAGGAINGFVQIDNTLNVSGEATLNSYLNFGLLWRVSGSADGKRLVFQYRKDTESPYKNAVPFISSN